jgi:putative hemolysin
MSLNMAPLFWFELTGFLMLLAASGFFSSAETALFSLDPHEVNRIGETHPEKAEVIRELLAQPTRLLSTILIGNTVVNVNLWLVGAMVLTRTGLVNPAAQVLVLTALTLLFGEFGPKRLAILCYEQMSVMYSGIFLRLVHWLRVPRSVLESFTGTFSHFFMPSGHILSKAEYDTLMEASEETGELDDHEHVMVQSILSLERLKAGDVMTPRVDIEGVDLADGDVEFVEEAKKARTRHLVLYREQLDEITGLLDVRAYLLDPQRRLDRATLKPMFVPEFVTLDKLLPRMVAAKLRSAIVVDEYGGTAGIISRGDILEELTGEMDVEDSDRLICEPLTENAWLMDAQMSLYDVNRITGLHLESETADRLSGWFIEKAEHLPKLNEIVRGPGFKAMVRQVRRNRLLLILVERRPDGLEDTQ